MPYLPLQWARQSVEGRQVEADGSRLFNWFAVRPARPVSEEAKVPVMLAGAPGRRRFARAAPRPFRRAGADLIPQPGVQALLPVESPVLGDRLFGISSSYQFFEIRTGGGLLDMPPGYATGDPLHIVPDQRVEQFTLEDSEAAFGPARMVTDGRFVMFVLRRDARVWDIAAGRFIPVPAPIPADRARTLPDEEWADAAWLDNYFVLAARSGQFFHSAAGGVSFDQLDFASAETKPDGIVAARGKWSDLFLFGTHSIELWESRPQGGDFAFSRNNGYRQNIGCLSREVVAETEDHIVFVSGNDSVYAIDDSRRPAKASTESVAYDIARCVKSEARATAYTEEDHSFYSLDLLIRGGERKNWTLDLSTGLWHERSPGPLCAARWRGANLAGYEGDDLIYEASQDFGDDDGGPVRREAIGPVVHADNRRATIHDVQVEVPPRPGGDPDDRMLLEWSDDGQRTWKGAARGGRRLDEGLLRWNALGQFRGGRHFRISTEAARRVDVLGAYFHSDVDLP